MTEKEKMLAGMLYNANFDEELISERIKCKVLCQEYNNISVENINKRKEKLKEIIGKLGENFTIEPNFWCDYGYLIEIGENFYANHGLTILDGAGVVFGDNVFIGPNCGFHTACHPIDYISRNKGFEYAKKIIVGDNVWIGANVQVLAGVSIGDNAVIGAGSVVTKDIPSNTVAVGNPCRVIRKIND